MAGSEESFPSTYILRKRLQRIKRRLRLSRKQAPQVFDEIYRTNNWGDSESVSGPGSTLARTDKIRSTLPSLLQKYDCFSLLDIPCGDFNWMKSLERKIEYIGADIVDALVSHNQERYAGGHRKFVKLDHLQDAIPRMELVICCNVGVMTAVRSRKASGSEHLLTTAFWERRKNQGIGTGEWRPTNLRLQSFCWGAPLEDRDDSYGASGHYDEYTTAWEIQLLQNFHDPIS